MSKYDALYKYFSDQTSRTLALIFSQIEKILNAELPQSAHKYTAWWANSTTKDHPHSHAWTDAGYYTVDVNDTIDREVINFKKWK